MKRYLNLKIRINGHTDDRGSENVNLKLSERRAKAVVDYLVEKDINPGRLQYKGSDNITLWNQTQPKKDKKPIAEWNLK